jgi:hypothetical protein
MSAIPGDTTRDYLPGVEIPSDEEPIAQLEG